MQLAVRLLLAEKDERVFLELRNGCGVGDQTRKYIHIHIQAFPAEPG